jgi:hypothetical protein
MGKNIWKMVISRQYSQFDTKGGIAIFQGHELMYRCKAIELPWNGNQHDVSCIPEGTYPCSKIVSPTKGKCFLVHDVPDRDSIEIHIGNYVAGGKIDSKGCILPGIYFSDLNKDGYSDIGDSTPAMNKLLSVLPDEFTLIIC